MNDPFRVGLLASPFLPKATQGMNVCANYNTMQLFMQVFVTIVCVLLQFYEDLTLSPSTRVSRPVS